MTTIVNEKLRTDYLDLLAEFGLQEPEKYVPKHTPEQEDMLRQLNALGVGRWQSLPVVKRPMDQAGTSVYRDNTLLPASNERVLRWIRKSGLAPGPTIGETFVGEFPTGSANAEARKTANGFLILVNSGLVYFIKQIFEALVAPEEGHYRELAISFATINYLLRRDAEYLPAFPIEGLDSLHVQILSSACYDFVLAHEYGHILRGHLSSDANPARILSTGVGAIPVLNMSWEQEYEADEFASNIITTGKEALSDEMINRAMQMTSTPQTEADWLAYLRVSGVMAEFVAPFFFFTIEKLLIETSAKLREAQITVEINSTHPPDELRQKNLLVKLGAKNSFFLSPNNYFISWILGLERLIEPVLVQAKSLAPIFLSTRAKHGDSPA